MKRIYSAMMALIVMTVLNVGNAHSGSGTFGESLSVSSETVKDSTTEQKEEYTLSQYEPMDAVITCGGNANIPDGERFQIVLNGEAFIDRATCLIWEMSPLEQDLTLPETTSHCNSLETGNRYDWRVPNVFELMLLEDSIDGSLRPWVTALQCSNLNYGGVGEYHCKGWTKTPAMGGPVGSYFVITIDHGSLGWRDLNAKAYPFCVRGSLPY